VGSVQNRNRTRRTASGERHPLIQAGEPRAAGNCCDRRSDPTNSAGGSAHGFKPVALKLTANLTLHNQVQSIVSHNVVALVKAGYPQQVVATLRTGITFGSKRRPDGKPQMFHGAIRQRIRHRRLY